jgi:hypothetical protein
MLKAVSPMSSIANLLNRLRYFVQAEVETQFAMPKE